MFVLPATLSQCMPDYLSKIDKEYSTNQTSSEQSTREASRAPQAQQAPHPRRNQHIILRLTSCLVVWVGRWSGR